MDMEVERGPFKTTILYSGPLMCFHVNLGEGATSKRVRRDLGSVLVRFLGSAVVNPPKC